MALPLVDTISSYPKANKNEVFVVDLSTSDFVTSIVAAKKGGDALRAGLADAVSGLSSVHLRDSVRAGLGFGKGRRVHLHDWGGVIQIADEGGRTALKPDTLKDGDHAVFSFTPWSEKKKPELPRMAALAREAGFSAMFIVTKKEGTCGKADTFKYLRDILDHANAAGVTYYEDTYGVLKDCVPSCSGRDTLYHVFHPEHPFEVPTPDSGGMVYSTEDGIFYGDLMGDGTIRDGSDTRLIGMVHGIVHGDQAGYVALWETPESEALSGATYKSVMDALDRFELGNITEAELRRLL